MSNNVWLKTMGEDGVMSALSFPFLRHVMSVEWREKSACGSLPKEVFFNYNSMEISSEQRKAYKQTALSACASCPVRAECHEFAVCNNEPFGIWAGLTPDQRKPFVKKFKTTGILETLPV